MLSLSNVTTLVHSIEALDYVLNFRSVIEAIAHVIGFLRYNNYILPMKSLRVIVHAHNST